LDRSVARLDGHVESLGNEMALVDGEQKGRGRALEFPIEHQPDRGLHGALRGAGHARHDQRADRDNPGDGEDTGYAHVSDLSYDFRRAVLVPQSLTTSRVGSRFGRKNQAAVKSKANRLMTWHLSVDAAACRSRDGKFRSRCSCPYGAHSASMSRYNAANRFNPK